MKIVVQRVKESSVKVDGKIVGKSGYGYLLLVSFPDGDNEKIIDYIRKPFSPESCIISPKGGFSCGNSEKDGRSHANDQRSARVIYLRICGTHPFRLPSDCQH